MPDLHRRAPTFRLNRVDIEPASPPSAHERSVSVQVFWVNVAHAQTPPYINEMKVVGFLKHPHVSCIVVAEELCETSQVMQRLLRWDNIDHVRPTHLLHSLSSDLYNNTQVEHDRRLREMTDVWQRENSVEIIATTLGVYDEKHNCIVVIDKILQHAMTREICLLFPIFEKTSDEYPWRQEWANHGSRISYLRNHVVYVKKLLEKQYNLSVQAWIVGSSSREETPLHFEFECCL
jgi:hypothetical protein